MDLFTIEHVVFSLFVNAVGLCAISMMSTAPPRLVVYTCLANMVAITVPWVLIGTHIPLVATGQIVIFTGNITAAGASETFGFEFDQAARAFGIVWLTVGVLWLAVTVFHSIWTTSRWRAVASSGESLAAFCHPAFAKQLRRSQVHRIPNASMVFATGLWHPEIWLGDRIRDEAQIEVALNHELSHLAARDQWILLLVVCVERMLWWNPLIWILGRRARRSIEYACDARCQTIMGAEVYRRSLAQLFLGDRLSTSALETPLGSASDVINRMEHLDMTHSLDRKHLSALAAASLLVAFTSAGVTAQASNSRGDAVQIEPMLVLDIEDLSSVVEIGDFPDRPHQTKSSSDTLTTVSSFASPVSRGASTANPAVLECHKLVPQGHGFSLVMSEVNTGDGKRQIGITAVDTSNPGSNKVSEEAQEFLDCLQKAVAGTRK